MTFADRIAELTFHVPPECQGQIVETSYAADEYGLVRRHFDRSDRSESYEVSPWPADDAFAFEPQNGEPSHTDLVWTPAALAA